MPVGREMMENEEKKPETGKKKSIKELVKALGAKIIGVFRDYPVTMIAIMLAALIASILVDWNNTDTEIYLERAAVFFLITAVGTLFFEETFPQNRIVRIAGYASSAIVSFLFVWILSYEGDTLFGTGSDVTAEITARILAVYGVILIGFSIWHMFRRLEDDFEVYATKAFLELLKPTVIYGLFAGGLATIILIFNALIFDTDDFLAQAEIFLASGIYVPMCLKAISGKNEEPGKFFRVCIHYALLPMLLIAFVIIYLYIGKIFLMRDIPSNKIFPILAGLFSIGMPVWTLVHGMQQKDDFLSKAARFLPYVFVPFLFLQCWSIALRVGQYGITPDRYWAIILILGEAIYFVLYFLHHKGHKQAISWTLFAAMIICFFTVLCPGTTYDDMTIRSQMARLEKMLENPFPSQEDKQSIRSTYNKINRLGYKGRGALNKKLSKAQKEVLESYSDYNAIARETVYLHAYQSTDYIDVTGYNHIYEVSTYGDKNYLGDGKLSVQYTNYKKREASEPFLADLSGLIAYAYTFTKGYDEGFTLEGHEVCPVDENHAIWITSFNINFDKDTKEIISINLHGYLMEK